MGRDAFSHYEIPHCKCTSPCINLLQNILGKNSTVSIQQILMVMQLVTSSCLFPWVKISLVRQHQTSLVRYHLLLWPWEVSIGLIWLGYIHTLCLDNMQYSSHPEVVQSFYFTAPKKHVSRCKTFWNICKKSPGCVRENNKTITQLLDFAINVVLQWETQHSSVLFTSPGDELSWRHFFPAKVCCSQLETMFSK